MHTRLTNVKHPSLSVFAKCCRQYLKYKCSNAKRTTVNNIPHPSNRKALIN